MFGWALTLLGLSFPVIRSSIRLSLNCTSSLGSCNSTNQGSRGPHQKIKIWMEHTESQLSNTAGWGSECMSLTCAEETDIKGDRQGVSRMRALQGQKVYSWEVSETLGSQEVPPAATGPRLHFASENVFPDWAQEGGPPGKPSLSHLTHHAISGSL